MSASKGSSSNSSKTAHVMNLLRKSNPAPAAPPPEQTESAPAPAPVPSTPSQISPIISVLNPDAEVSIQIRDALNDALEQELAQDLQSQPSVPQDPPGSPSPVIQPPAEPSPDPIPESDPIPEPAVQPELPPVYEPQPPVIQAQEPSQEPVYEPAPAPAAPTEPVFHDVPTPEEPATVSAPVAESTESAASDVPAPAASLARPPLVSSGEAVLINVTQRLAEERADKYIGLFGLCTCKRCRDDVLAITLNELHPKYVVMRPSELTIRFDMYANRYSSEITAQLLRACKEVMEHPRHDDPSSATATP